MWALVLVGCIGIVVGLSVAFFPKDIVFRYNCLNRNMYWGPWSDQFYRSVVRLYERLENHPLLFISVIWSLRLFGIYIAIASLLFLINEVS